MKKLDKLQKKLYKQAVDCDLKCNNSVYVQNMFKELVQDYEEELDKKNQQIEYFEAVIFSQAQTLDAIPKDIVEHHRARLMDEVVEEALDEDKDMSDIRVVTDELES